MSIQRCQIWRKLRSFFRLPPVLLSFNRKSRDLSSPNRPSGSEGGVI